MQEPTSASASPSALRIGTVVSHRYVIEREIGRGGMATVYLARDDQYHRAVALKLLSAELSGSTATDRFRREIQIAARLNHPNIIALLDSGSFDGALFYVMPHVEGESLRERLKRERPIDVDEAITMTLQVASALAHAHRHGVIHRDIKPDNILLHEGQALVADFGIARALDSTAAVTATGVFVGTPAYMSPEQVSGDRELDARSDIYSLACVLYEMLVGDAPHGSSDPNVAMAKKLIDGVTRPRAIRRAIPRSVETVVLRALARAPADRYASAEDFATALANARLDRGVQMDKRRLAIAALAVVVLVSLSATAIARYARRAIPLRSLAILPCVDARQNRSEPYLVEALTYDLIGRASRSGAFDKVIAMPSVQRYRGASMSPSRIGSELNVDDLLYCEYGAQTGAGSEGVRIQLVRSRDASLLWSGALHRTEATGQSDLATMVLDSLIASGVVRSRPRTPAPSQGMTTGDPPALRLYKEGRFYLAQFQQDAVRRSIRLFREAIARDSGFALPYVALAQAYWTLGMGHGDMDEREAFALVRDLASHALNINDQIAEAHLHLGAYEFFFGWNWSVAERELRRAIELDPNLATAFDIHGQLLSLMNRETEATAASDRAIALSPVDPIMWGNAGLHRIFHGRYREAVSFLEKGLELAPSFHPDQWALGVALVELGEMQRGVELLRSADSLSGRAIVFRGYHAWGLARSGNTRAARAILAELSREEARTGSGKSAAMLAQIHFGLNEPDSAFVWLERAYDRRASIMPVVLLGSVHRYRHDPRHASLMRKLGMPPR